MVEEDVNICWRVDFCLSDIWLLSPPTCRPPYILTSRTIILKTQPRVNLCCRCYQVAPLFLLCSVLNPNPSTQIDPKEQKYTDSANQNPPEFG